METSVVFSPEGDGVPEQIARQVRAGRLARGWSQDTLAEKAGVSQATISRVEMAMGDPSAAVLSSLASALGITLTIRYVGVARESSEG